MTDSPIISVRGLEKVYRVGEVDVRALRGLDMDVRRGEFVAVIGPSGSGKSTLFHILGGLTPPSAGTVVIDGKDLMRMSDRERTNLRKKTVGFVFQKYNSASDAHGAGQHRDRAGYRRRNWAGGAGAGRDAAPSGNPRTDESQASGAFGRRAAAGGHRPSAGESSGDSAGGRADGESGYAKFERRAWLCCAT